MTAPLTRTPGLAEVVSDTRVTVLNLPRLDEQQVPYVFEGSAFDIWERIDGTHSADAIIAELADAYGVAHEVIAPEVASFIAQLAELGLVR